MLLKNTNYELTSDKDRKIVTLSLSVKVLLLTLHLALMHT